MSADVSELQAWFGASASRRDARVGKANTGHLSNGNDETLCKRVVSEYLSKGDVLSDGFKLCRSCYTTAEKIGAQLLATNTEGNTMATARKTAAKSTTPAETPETPAAEATPETPAAEATTPTPETPETPETPAEGPETPETPAEGPETPEEGFPTNGETTERVLRDAAARAAAAAAATPPAESSTEVEVPAKPQTDRKLNESDAEVIGLLSLATKAASAYRDGSNLSAAATREVAIQTLKLRTRLVYEGKPDILGKSGASRKATDKVLKDAGFQEVKKPDEDGVLDPESQLTKNFSGALRVMMMDVRVEYLRALDNNPAELEKYDGCKSSADVFKLYGVENELQSERRRRLKNEKKAAKELAPAPAPAPAADGTELETVTAEAAPAVKPVAFLDRVVPALPGLLDYVATLEGENVVKFMEQLDSVEAWIAASRKAIEDAADADE
jgi:hypothetical protein